MLFVHGASVTAVVRGSTGEPVVLISEQPFPGATGSHRTDLINTDLANAARAVLDAAEFRVFERVTAGWGTGVPDRFVTMDGDVLSVFEVRVD
ncbi:hypothetical protein GTW40_28790 [Streptomyces sp. SID4985]|uniref:hypothetical protein n=1 Tax=Streptomyces sp. SID4985 TaxID=2690292 RepID=UPI001369C584|nr:hypothetical protein [Streptomyces sp. SID4985]MYQ48973.1 hypothetical protein [Streptomyces sp. SID4985]